MQENEEGTAGGMDTGMEEMMQVEEAIQERSQEAIQKMNRRIRRQLKSPTRKRAPLSEVDGNIRKLELNGKRKNYQEDTDMVEIGEEMINSKWNKLDESLESWTEEAESGGPT